MPILHRCPQPSPTDRAQVAITIALSISLIEGSVFYLYYFLYNNTGDFSACTPYT